MIVGMMVIGFSIDAETQNECVPEEQTYEYLFNKVDSNYNHIVRTDYYGRSYLTIPLLDNSCSAEDYISITQNCITPIKFVLGEDDA